jgi:hypothetical protein
VAGEEEMKKTLYFVVLLVICFCHNCMAKEAVVVYLDGTQEVIQMKDRHGLSTADEIFVITDVKGNVVLIPIKNVKSIREK